MSESEFAKSHESDHENQSILLIKPCGMRKFVGNCQLQELIMGLVASSGLSIVDMRDLVLTKEQIRKMYPKLDLPDFVNGDEWKDNLIEHLQSGLSAVYNLSGEQAYKKAKNIRDNIRQQFAAGNNYTSILLENLIHVSDTQDYKSEYGIFFGDK